VRNSYYARACRRFTRWLGSPPSPPLPTPADLIAANVARYHAHLVAGGRSTATVRKDRAAIFNDRVGLAARA
jgi:hypothetical protein